MGHSVFGIIGEEEVIGVIGSVGWSVFGIKGGEVGDVLRSVEPSVSGIIGGVEESILGKLVSCISCSFFFFFFPVKWITTTTIAAITTATITDTIIQVFFEHF